MPIVPLRNRRSPLVLAALSVVFLGACVQPGDPDVGVQPLSADIVFGAPPPGGALPNTAPLVAPAVPFDDTDLTADFEPVEAPPVPSRPRPPRIAPLCRTATVNDFASESAPDFVTTRPTPGTYLWKRGGTQLADGKTVDLTGFEDRVVQNVRQVDPKDGGIFEYEVVQKTLDGSVQTSKYRVRPKPPNPPNQNVNNNFPPVFVNTGEPDRGLSLVSMSTRSPAGVVTSFNPNTPLLLLPMTSTGGIDSGPQWTATSVDPTTFNGIQIQGGVIGHTEVDACGTVIDGWKVQSTLTYTNSKGEMRAKYDYVVASQFGALIIAETVEAPLEKPTLKANFNIGQIAPRPPGA